MRNFFFLLLSLAFIACNSNEEDSDSVLSQPPFVRLTDSIQQSPKDAGLHFRRGILLYQNNQTAYAEQDFKKAWQLQPDEEYALSLAAILKNKNADSALFFLEEATHKLPNSVALQIGLARGYQKKGETEKALAIVDKIIEEQPGQLDALTLKSEILAAQNNQSGSLAYLEKAHSLVPSDPELAFNLAYEYADAKNSKAITLADSLLKAKVAEPEKAYYIKGVYFSNTNNAVQALKNFDNAIAANYNFLDAYRDKGQLLLDQKKYNEALKTFQLAQKVAPANAEFYFLIGKAQEALGNKQDAKLNYQRAYGLDRSMTEAKEAADKL
ncbi:MAG: tetratricopeptide repeat protein [Flavisolibacter sp.]|jgi:tetratricopeptide (TPR) repeat protein